MKRFLLLFMSSLLMVVNLPAQIWDGDPFDSVIISFSDSLHLSYLPDSAASPLWQIGKTHKSCFALDTNGVTGLMTDTLNLYPINSDNWFIFKVLPGHIIGFWHRYETDSSKDGGAMEFSLDSGYTWQNVVGDCNIDGDNIFAKGVRTENFYSKTDTLQNGIPAFSGKRNLTRFSRFQFSHGYLSSSDPCPFYWDIIYVRFRFISDSVADTFAGWIIDSIKIESDAYAVFTGGLEITTMPQPSPNPSSSGIFTFPALKEETRFRIEVYNILGQTIIQAPYTHSLNVSQYPRGLYFYRVTGGNEYYSGRLLYD